MHLRIELADAGLALVEARAAFMLNKEPDNKDDLFYAVNAANNRISTAIVAISKVELP